MNALVLCAGLGTRLRPLTDRIPKPLVPVVDQTLLSRVVDRVAAPGVRVFANSHHLAERISEFAARDGRVEKVFFEPEILGTAGPLARMAREAERDELLVANGDAWHGIDLREFAERARKTGAEVVLLGRNDPRVNTLAEEGGKLAGVKGRFGSDRGSLTFTGISWYAPSALERIPEGLFDVREFWRSELEAGRAPALLEAPESARWIDVGTPAGLLEATAARLDELGLDSWGEVPESAALVRSAVCAGGSCGEGCVLERSLVLPGGRVAAGERLSGVVVGDGFRWEV